MVFKLSPNLQLNCGYCKQIKGSKHYEQANAQARVDLYAEDV